MKLESMIVTPIAPQALPASPLLNSTRSFYQVLTLPAPLASMRHPEESWPWDALQEAGFTSIVCLTHSSPRYDPAPLRILYSADFQDLLGGRPPRDPAREADMLFEAVGRVCTELMAGRGVVVHCQGGTGRTGTVIACTLRAMGVPCGAIIKYMDSVNRARNKYPDWHGWPESPWQKQQVERFDRRQDV